MAGLLSRSLSSLAQKSYASYRGMSYRYKAAEIVRQSLSKSLDETKNYQLAKLKELVAYAYQHSLFYRNSFDKAKIKPEDIKDFSDFAKLPLLTKDDIRDHVKDFLSDEFDESDLILSATGGSTGIPVKFYRSKKCHLFHWGLDIAMARYYGWRLGDWQGWLWGASRDVIFPSGIKAMIRHSLLERTFFLDTAEINNEAYERFIGQIHKHKPTFISGYPSVVYDLALRVEAGQVTPVKLPMVSCTAEQMHDFQREKIASVLTDKLYERYGSREIGTASFECHAHNGQHIFCESLYIEAIPTDDDSGLKKLIVTDLVNFGMPFIRYDIADIGDIDENKCLCGMASPRIIDLSGRHVDLLWRPDGRAAAAHLSHMVAGSGLKTSIQIIQERTDKLIIRVEGTVEDNFEALKIIRNNLLERLGEGISCDFEAVDKIHRTASGKYQYVVSKIERLPR